MKKIILCLAAVLTMVTYSQAQVQTTADMNENAVMVAETAPEGVDMAEQQALMTRLQEIEAMDKSDLTRAEKRALRQEVRNIEKAMHGGLYISGGALLVIILLIILL